ncbi:hypothetical protein EDB89DRAFT_2239157 [Lactarius sanguifluus]|nr:hypothetical protein EDB89DRAFT_2239157 [Lactarius sanguifluus]
MFKGEAVGNEYGVRMNNGSTRHRNTWPVSECLQAICKVVSVSVHGDMSEGKERVKKRLGQKKIDEDCCLCRPHMRPPHRRHQSRPVTIPVVPAAVPSAAASSLATSSCLHAANLRRGRVVVAPLSRHCRAVVTPSSRHRYRLSLCELSSCGLHHAACVIAWGPHQSGGGGLQSESTCGSGVGGGHRWGWWRLRSWPDAHST